MSARNKRNGRTRRGRRGGQRHRNGLYGQYATREAWCRSLSLDYLQELAGRLRYLLAMFEDARSERGDLEAEITRMTEALAPVEAELEHRLRPIERQASNG